MIFGSVIPFLIPPHTQSGLRSFFLRRECAILSEYVLPPQNRVRFAPYSDTYPNLALITFLVLYEILYSPAPEGAGEFEVEDVGER
jgi:hypothetical protein